MSDYYTYRLIAPLVSAFRDEAAFVADAADHDIYFDFNSRPMATSTSFPSFGSGTECEVPSFDIWGVSVADGVLSLGVFATNLERDAEEENEDGSPRAVSGTRLERLFSYLSKVTKGEIGEIQGAYSSERWDFEVHAHPIVRCGDGKLRVAPTPVSHRESGNYWSSDEPDSKTIIPAVLPFDLVSSGYSRGKISIDIAKLVARFAPETDTGGARSLTEG